MYNGDRGTNQTTKHGEHFENITNKKSKTKQHHFNKHQQTNQEKSEQSKMANKAMIESMAAKERKKRGSNERFKFTKGRTIIRVMPPARGMPMWWFTASIHWTPMKTESGNEIKFPVLCNDSHGIGECRICKRQKGIQEDPNAQAHEIAWATQVEVAQTNFVSLVNLEDIVGPQVCAMCDTIFDRLMEFEIDGYEITDPDNGFDIAVGREIKNKFPSYSADTVRHPSPMGDKDMLKNLVDLLTQVPIFTPAQQDQVIRMDGEAIEADDVGRQALRSKLRAGYVAEANEVEAKGGPAPAAPPEPAPPTPAVIADAEYWAVVDGATKSLSVEAIKALGEDINVMPKGGTEWVLASTLGILSTPEPTPAALPDAPMVEPVADKVQYWATDAAGAVVLMVKQEVNVMPKATQVMVVGTTEWTTAGELGMGV